MNYTDKQEWIEAVMASDLGAATKVYAYGIFKHMYGTKDNAFPSGKAIAKATGLATGKFYLHNKALAEAGFLEVTHRVGRSNLYQLAEPTHRSGNHLPTEGVGVPTEGVTPTHRRGTNTTSNTSSKTSKSKTSKSATAPVDSPLIKSENVPSSLVNQTPSFEEIVEPLLAERRFSLQDPIPTDAATPSPDTHRLRVDAAMSAQREREALTAMGIDLDGEW